MAEPGLSSNGGDLTSERPTSLEKGLRLVQELAATKSSLTVAELAVVAGLNRSTTYRLCKSLERAGWIQTIGDGESATRRRVDVGPSAFGFSVLVTTKYDSSARLQPIMDELARAVGETVHAGVLEDTSVVHVGRAVPPSGPHMALEVGAREVAHITSLGKAILATLDRADVLRRYPREELSVPTRNAIGTRTLLLEELERIAGDGYAVDDQESSSGVKCIGAPVFGPGGSALLAISVTAIPQHLEGDRMGAVASAVCEAAARATAAFGGTLPAGFAGGAVHVAGST